MPDDDLTTQTESESTRPAPRRRRAAGRAAGPPPEHPDGSAPDGAVATAAPSVTNDAAGPPAPAAVSGEDTTPSGEPPSADAPATTRRRTRTSSTTRTRSTRATRAKADDASDAATVDPAAAQVAATADPAVSGAVPPVDLATSPAAAPADAATAAGGGATEGVEPSAPARRTRATRSRRAVRDVAAAEIPTPVESVIGADATAAGSSAAAGTTPAPAVAAGTATAASTESRSAPAPISPVAGAPSGETAAAPPVEDTPKPKRTRARRAASGPVTAPVAPPAAEASASTTEASATEPSAVEPSAVEPAPAVTAPAEAGGGEPTRTRATRTRTTRRRATAAKGAPAEAASGSAPAAEVSAAGSSAADAPPGPAPASEVPADEVPSAAVAEPSAVTELSAGAEPPVVDAAAQPSGVSEPPATGTPLGSTPVSAPAGGQAPAEGEPVQPEPAAAESASAGTRTRTRTRRVTAPTWAGIGDEPPVEPVSRPAARRPVAMVTFQAPEPAAVEARWRRADAADEAGSAAESAPTAVAERPAEPELADEDTDTDIVTEELTAVDEDGEFDDDDQGGGSGSTRRRRRGRRGRGRARGDEDGTETDVEDGVGETDEAPRAADATDRPGRGGELEPAAADGGEAAERADDGDDEDEDDRAGGSRRRRRRRRRAGGDEPAVVDDPPNTVVHVREIRRDDDLVRGLSGSTRLEAKRQRRREGRDSGRRRPPIVTEAEFLARREAVERRMIVRHAGDRTQIAVLEDSVLVEHFVTRASSASYAGNVYLGRVQNVLASMEAAFVDIGKGRNAVLYAGEVNYDASGLDGRPRKIEQVLKSGQSVLVQVSKDPIGHKGARLTSQISLPGRYLVYVPDGQNAGISRKLPDTERARLKSILKKITPEDGGVIVRTAAEGASEAELERDIERLAAQWEDIERRAKKASAPALLYGEPDLVVRVIRDIFNEDFTELVVQGSGEAATIEEYIDAVAPDLRPRIRRYTGSGDVFVDYRVDEQLAKALDRKVWLPSGGSLVIDRTEAMTVIDVNTGKFTGKGGNLEETVTKNNLEAAEEIVRQLRLRDIGGIIVIDFIDMVLESNRELVLRRLTECLGRDRTRHQVAEVTSLGLVQMTRKRVGQGLLEAYSEPCVHCNGRGVLIHLNGGGGGHAHPAAGSVAAGSGAGQSEPAAVGSGSGGSGRRSRGAATRAAGGPALVAAASVGAPAGDTEVAGGAVSAADLVQPAAADNDDAGMALGDAGGAPDSPSAPTGVVADAAAAGPIVAVNGNGHVPAGAVAVTAPTAPLAQTGGGDSAPPVYANSDDPDSLATADSGVAAGKPVRSRRRRASRPVSKPAESLESVPPSAESTGT
ncbi:ribonuclease, Rne/Rng family [Frankia torreyi]|uniref:Ribonuclease E n=1 Tax=Frankia torreyi TaxID=1856 RepID=A0A0D8BMQ2_9ACTN|nr:MULTISPECIES: ribonuclease E/G [Frankia]KJE25493.1 ribonuclease, Rne/Rng family [Frankia torreyi]KQC38536.1 ribonuclease [Frankia sp. ACN1ag]